MPQPSVIGPLGERDLPDQTRGDPLHLSSIRARHVHEGAARLRQGAQVSGEVAQHGVGESGADLSDINKALWTGQAEKQSADHAGTTSITRLPAADNDFLRADVLDLD